MNLLIYDDLRHYMAHGFMRIDVDNAGGHGFEFLRYVREDQGEFQMMSAKTDIRRLKQAVEDTGDYVRDVINLFERIYREKKLEPWPMKGASGDTLFEYLMLHLDVTAQTPS